MQRFKTLVGIRHNNDFEPVDECVNKFLNEKNANLIKIDITYNEIQEKQYGSSLKSFQGKYSFIVSLIYEINDVKEA